MSYPSWLEQAIFYEIYPQSFYDSNGDGIGDIPGIIAKLEYIESLGCNALWLNPCFVSPFQDAGYDVSDYYTVAPRYGSNDDLIRLFQEAEKRGIRVCLDLVPGHTSIEHPWFKESCRNEPNPYTNRYIWTDSIWDQDDGFRLINGYAQRNGNFVTNFFYCQPALNYGFARPDPDKPWQLAVDHPDVLALREEIKKIIRFWLDLGASGFRVDMAHSLVKNDDDRIQTQAFWQNIRRMIEQDYPQAVLISEWGYPPQAVPAGFHIDFLLHFNTLGYSTLFRYEDPWHSRQETGHSFFSRNGNGDSRFFFDEYLRFQQEIAGRGFLGLPTGNHDMPRISRHRSPEEIALVMAFVLTMPGIPFLYYGDEIGLRYLEDLPSKEGGYDRTGSRTPMQWDDGVNAGFSTASPDALYLPVDPDPDRPNVASQQNGESLLNAVRKLIALRRNHGALQAAGAFQPVFAETGVYPLVYLRSDGTENFLIVINPAEGERGTAFTLPAAVSAPQNPCLLLGTDARLTVSGRKLDLAADGLSYSIYRYYNHKQRGE